MRKLFDYFHPLERIKRRRGNYVTSVNLPEVLFDLVNQPVPLVDDLANKAEFIVLDFETTGLDSDNDLILSMGWVSIIEGRIDLATAKHIFLNNHSQINPETAVINHITPQMLQEEGAPINDAMYTFFTEAKGKIIVAHACTMEERFLAQYLLKTYGLRAVPLLWLDTLCIEKSLEKTISNHDKVDLTLFGSRQRYGLPEYNSHNALIDAVSTAELFLAQQKRINKKGYTRIADLYRMSQ